MKSIRFLAGLILLSMVYSGCVRDSILLDEDVIVEGLDPSFAAPLVEASLNIGDIEENVDSENFVYNEDNASFALVYPEELFSITAEEIFQLPIVNESYNYALDAGQATALNAVPAGGTVTYPFAEDLPIAMPNGEQIDLVKIKSGSLVISSQSEIPHDFEATFDLPLVDASDQATVYVYSSDYSGSTPFGDAQSWDLAGHTLDLTGDGSESNLLTIEADLEITSSGATSNPGDDIQFNFQFVDLVYERIEGDLGQNLYVFDADTQDVDLFKDLNGGILHFEDPTIEVHFFNSSGVSFGLDFTSLIAPENDVASDLTGPDLTNIPVIAAAENFGDDVQTDHTINNTGTSPTLSAMLDEGPFQILYSSEVETNPDGLTENFILDTSRLACNVEVVLPFYGYADNFSIADTLDLNLEEELGLDEIDSSDVLTIDDVERLTLRIEVDNGMPVEVGVQLVFADSFDNVIDSLFIDETYHNIFDPGFVDFSLPPDDPLHGKVISSTVTTTTVVVTPERLQFLLDNNSQKVFLRARGNTSMSGDQELIKIFPEYDVDIRVSAKVDLQIDLSE